MVFVHSSSVIDDDVIIGAGSKIWHFCHVSSGARLGENCILGQNVFVGTGVQIGNRVKIQNNVSVYTGVVLGDDVFCGPSMVFTNVHNPRSHVERKNEIRTTHVGRGASFGANCTIVCGNRIGEYAFVGAGAVVSKPVKDFAIMVGNPAVQIGWMSKSGTKLALPLTGDGIFTAEDGHVYKMTAGEIQIVG